MRCPSVPAPALARLCAGLAVILATALSATADSVVTFNEVMYHPEPDEGLEWLELHNQMAVDVELSAWTLSGGIEFQFVEGTVIPGGGYLVLAASPTELASAGMLTNALGPWVGRLSNAGERIQLRNRDQRLMDELEYGVDGEWPVGPDGAGVSLAKRDEDAASPHPESWTTSALVGGTPGRRNFVKTPFELIETSPVGSSNVWAWALARADAPSGIDWRDPAFDDALWGRGPGPFGDAQSTASLGDLEPVPTLFSSGVSADGTVLPPGSSDPHYSLTKAAQSTGQPLPASATVIENHPAWAANDAELSWIGVVNPGTENVAAGEYRYRTTFNLDGFDPATAQVTMTVGADNRLTSVLLNGVSKSIAYVGFSEMSGEFALADGFIPGLNTLDFVTVNDSTTPNPAGFRVRLNGVARKHVPPKTRLPEASVSYWLRTPFTLDNAPERTAAHVQAFLSGGALFYLNGQEAARWNLPTGAITPSTAALSNVANPTLEGPWPVPTSALVKGTNILAVELHRAPGQTNLLFAASLSQTTTNVLQPEPVALAFNETSSADPNAEFWIELVNFGPLSLDLQGYLLARRGASDQDHVLAAATLAPGALTRFSELDLGFRAEAGDRLFLKAPDGLNVLDAVVVKQQPQARWPDGTGRWHSPTTPTPGEPNQIVLQNDIVINEIMYHAPEGASASEVTGIPSAESWIELHHRGAEALDLAGWRIAGDIDYPFPPGTMMEPGGYLVIAKNPEFMAADQAGIRGPFEGTLKKKRGRLLLLDRTGNPADEVCYFDDRPWPAFADGGGSSLELRDPWADNMNSAAWAASDESGRSTWEHYTYRGLASNVLGPTLWKEFVLGLLDAGECLLDDLSVVEDPWGTRVEMLQNGTFESGAAAWRLLGNHSHSRVVTDPDDPTNHVLHLVATGPTEHLQNHLETTFARGLGVVNGRQYEISFRAKWLAGNPRLNTRLYFNRVARTTSLKTPTRRGTPGVRNSTWSANLGPAFAELRHNPVLPKPGEAVSVSVAAHDPQGVTGVTLWWMAGSGGWKSVPMPSNGPAANSDYSGYTALIPAQPTGTLVQFYVEAQDGLGARATFPAAGPNSRALFKVDTGKAVMKQLHRFRILMTPADAQRLHASTNVMSNDRIGATVIYDDEHPFYDVGVHLQGSERGRDNSSRVGFTIRFDSDQLFRGVHKTISIDRSGGYSGLGGKHDEILLWHALNRAGGLLGIDCDLVQCFAPRSQEDGTGLLRMAAFDSEYFDAQFDDGSKGNLYTLELIYYPTTTAGGNAQSPKLPQPDDVINVEIQNRGDDPEAYRWIFLQENQADLDDYSQVIALNKAFGLSGPNLEAATARVMDVDQWMRALAFKAFTGDVDTFTYGLNHNWKTYFRPDDGRALGLLWDMDFSFVQSTRYTSPGSASANMAKVTRLPNNLRLFYSHVLDIGTSAMDDAYLHRWASHYSGLLAQNWSRAADYLVQRSRYLLGTLPKQTPFAITSNGGADLTTSEASVKLTGTAPLTVFALEVNGIRRPVNWSSLTNWSLTLPLTQRTQQLVIEGLDRLGGRITNAVDSIQVTASGPLARQSIVINEWMADNSAPGGFADPATGLFSDWFELFNPNPDPFALSGYFLTDDPLQWDKFPVPASTVIPGGGFLIVWADGRPELNGASLGNGALHANFQLSKDGEMIGLFGPDGTPEATIAFGPQRANVSEGLFPDGAAEAVVAMPDWSPGAPNRLGESPAPQITQAWLSLDGGMTLLIRTVPGRIYRVEAAERLSPPSWAPMGEDRTAMGDSVQITDLSAPQTQRFYRVQLLR
ncbi:MAG: lamin tail domain-containing protein [Verrucomicrobiia bacterium]